MKYLSTVLLLILLASFNIQEVLSLPMNNGLQLDGKGKNFNSLNQQADHSFAGSVKEVPSSQKHKSRGRKQWGDEFLQYFKSSKSPSQRTKSFSVNQKSAGSDWIETPEKKTNREGYLTMPSSSQLKRSGNCSLLHLLMDMIVKESQLTRMKVILHTIN